MNVENIPPELLAALTSPYPGGSEFGQCRESAFLKVFPQGEDRTADSIMMDAWLSFTLQN